MYFNTPNTAKHAYQAKLNNLTGNRKLNTGWPLAAELLLLAEHLKRSAVRRSRHQ